MTIKFLTDYSVGTPPENFKAGQVLKNRDHASEAHFVRRKVAAYMAADGSLTDFDGLPVADTVTGPKPVKKPAGKAVTAKPKVKAKGQVKKTTAPAGRQLPASVIGVADVRPAAPIAKE